MVIEIRTPDNIFSFSDSCIFTEHDIVQKFRRLLSSLNLFYFETPTIIMEYVCEQYCSHVIYWKSNLNGLSESELIEEATPLLLFHIVKDAHQ